MKYGIYGGAFDPFHLEHLHVAECAKRELSLDRIVIVPSGNAPHKRTLTSFNDRVEMIKATMEDALIDDIEMTIGGLTNTARILPLLKEKYGDIVFIIGGDSFFALESWIQPEVVLSYPLAVVPRVGFRDKLVEKAEMYNALGKDVTVLDYIGKDVSSTLIRTRLSVGLPCGEISERCYEYALEHKLYSAYDDILDKLRKALKPERYLHSMRVAVAAVKLNEQLGLDYDKVMTAALLHDSSKYSTRPHLELPAELRSGPVAHAFIGAEEIQVDYGITDPDIINAVRYHTTGRPDMTPLEKLIYLADVIEEGRDFDGVDELRKISYENFEQGFLETVFRQYKYLGDGDNICSLTKECYDYYSSKK